MSFTVVVSLIALQLVFQAEGSSKNAPGIFYENDLEQTVNYYQVNDNIEKDELEEEILDLLGLPEGPKQNWAKESLRQSAPNFLLKMYEMVDESEPYRDNTSARRKRRSLENDDRYKLITPLDELELHESDNVITFMSSWIPLFNEPIFQNHHKNLLWFNTAKIPNELILVAAQLKVYKRKTTGKIQQLQISIYMINTQNRISIELNLLSSIKTTSNYEGWLQLNATAALSEWILDPNTNKGLYIETRFSDSNSRQPENKKRNSGLASVASDDQLKPFMVGYFKNVEETPLAVLKPKRTTFRNRRQYHLNRNGKVEEQIKTEKSCQRLSFSVDFKKLNWLNWVVAPEKFDSYFCSGDCSFPLNDMNTTNHAIIQTLAHLKNPNLPKPGCAPTALTSITIIYHISVDLVSMKKYNNMVVRDCGCL